MALLIRRLGHLRTTAPDVWDPGEPAARVVLRRVPTALLHEEVAFVLLRCGRRLVFINRLDIDERVGTVQLRTVHDGRLLLLIKLLRLSSLR